MSHAEPHYVTLRPVEKEHRPGAALDHLHFGKDNGNAWTFVLIARSQGWVVGTPQDNGFGYYNVEVWSRGATS